MLGLSLRSSVYVSEGMYLCVSVWVFGVVECALLSAESRLVRCNFHEI